MYCPGLLPRLHPLTLGAYDLAEWTSLHPSQVNTTPALIVPLLLRIHLPIIALLIGLSAHTPKSRIVTSLIIIVLAISQLPPFEFLTIATNNINYQQQFTLAIMCLIGGLSAIVFSASRFTSLFNVILVSIGFVSAILGIEQAQGLYLQSLQENTVGIGVFILCFAYLVIGIVNLPCSNQ